MLRGLKDRRKKANFRVHHKVRKKSLLTRKMVKKAAQKTGYRKE